MVVNNQKKVAKMMGSAIVLGGEKAARHDKNADNHHYSNQSDVWQTP